MHAIHGNDRSDTFYLLPVCILMYRHTSFFRKRRVQRVIYRLLIFLADLLEDTFWPTQPRNRTPRVRIYNIYFANAL